MFEREFPFTDEMLECETGSLLGRVADLERQSLAQRDEIVCLRATLADALRRIALLEGREKREDERNERRNERMVSSPLRNGHVSLRSKYKLDPCRLFCMLKMATFINIFNLPFIGKQIVIESIGNVFFTIRIFSEIKKTRRKNFDRKMENDEKFEENI